ncbi:ATP-binding cassette domain-containing protein [Mycetohabitans rhizoxinica]|uniref:ATP-binding cassette domain-containing protein n=1 Tax=Mycetohabitans rhizoxinica TaxID=412963 RepID=UPI0030D0DACC
MEQRRIAFSAGQQERHQRHTQLAGEGAAPTRFADDPLRVGERDVAAGVTGTAQPRDAARRAHSLLERVGLAVWIHHYPKHLSGGEQQRVALARAFVIEPDILFADEPTGSFDVANGLVVANLMFELNRASGATLVLVTHDTELAQRCDAILTLEAGRLA